MPTPSEQKALAFVAIVILLGGAVRVLRAGSPTGPTDLEQQAIARQAVAADSVSQARPARQGKRKRSARSAGKRETLPVVVGGVSSVPPSYARPDQPNARAPYGSNGSSLGFPPPDARVDTYAGGMRAQPTASGARSRRKLPPPSTSAEGSTSGATDLDVATESDVQRIPGIGPATARRIVANRDSLGPFRTLENLHRVKGIGPATLQKLAPFVTFSGSSIRRR